jgi:nicotinamidase-related amidase
VAKNGLEWGGQVFKDTGSFKKWLGAHGVTWEHFQSVHGGAAEGLASYEQTQKKTEAKRGVMWGGKVHHSRSDLEVWLKKRGKSYKKWSAAHPKAAKKLAEAEELEEASVIRYLTRSGKSALWKSELHPRGRGGKFIDVLNKLSAEPPPKTKSGRALIAVDVQPTFMPGGELGVPHGEEVVVPLVKIGRSAHIQLVAASGDWHPEAHISFIAQGGIWPPHGVAGTPNAEIVPEIQSMADIVVHKGTKIDKDAYSAFQGTGLAKKLRAQGIDRVVVGGLATDYCVKATAIDAAKAGFVTTVVLSASRGVDVKPGDSDRAVEEMRKSGVQVVKNQAELEGLIRQGKASPGLSGLLIPKMYDDPRLTKLKGRIAKLEAQDVPWDDPRLVRLRKSVRGLQTQRVRERLGAPRGKQQVPPGMTWEPEPGQMALPGEASGRDLARMAEMQEKVAKAHKAYQAKPGPETMRKLVQADAAYKRLHDEIYGTGYPLSKMTPALGAVPSSTWQSFSGVEAALGGKDSKQVGNNTWLERRPDGSIAMRLHQTDVLTFKPNSVVYDSGGWNTQTTHDRMGYGPAPVWSSKKGTVVHTPDGDVPFFDGIEVSYEGHVLNAPGATQVSPTPAAQVKPGSIDSAIADTLSKFPGLKDWTLEQTKDGFLVHVELDNGQKHTLSVGNNGQVADLSGPGEEAPISVDFKLSDYAYGDEQVLSHMAPGTYYVGHDGHHYQFLGDTWVTTGKKPVKAARTVNLDTGQQKDVPYFTVHGVEYTTLVKKGGGGKANRPGQAVSFREFYDGERRWQVEFDAQGQPVGYGWVDQGMVDVKREGAAEFLKKVEAEVKAGRAVEWEGGTIQSGKANPAEEKTAVAERARVGIDALRRQGKSDIADELASELGTAKGDLFKLRHVNNRAWAEYHRDSPVALGNQPASVQRYWEVVQGKLRNKQVPAQLGSPMRMGDLKPGQEFVDSASHEYRVEKRRKARRNRLKLRLSQFNERTGKWQPAGSAKVEPDTTVWPPEKRQPMSAYKLTKEIGRLRREERTHGATPNIAKHVRELEARLARKKKKGGR